MFSWPSRLLSFWFVWMGMVRLNVYAGYWDHGLRRGRNYTAWELVIGYGRVVIGWG